MQEKRSETTKEPTTTRVSELETGRERFLAHVIEHAFESGRRAAADFVRHFPPSLIMEGLKEQPELRAEILVNTVGLKGKVAVKKSWQSCADDLQIALDEGETTPEAIVGLFAMDDRVRYLSHTALWAFITEGEFWKTSPSRQKEYSAAKSHIAFMLTRALEDRLISHADIVDGITVEEVASRLPKSELGKIIKGALQCGKRGAPFLESDLITSMPPEVLVNYVPLFQVWDSVVDPRIAVVHAYRNGRLDAPTPAAVHKLEDIHKAEEPAEPPSEVAVPVASAASRSGAPMPKPSEEDPQRWSREFDEDNDFVDAADLMDEEPTVNRGAPSPV
jgi:hypothetical protein